MSDYTVAITGASGSIYGLRLIEHLLAAGQQVTMVFTEAGREVCAYETGFDLPAEEPARALLRFLVRGPLHWLGALDLAEPSAGDYRALRLLP